MDVSKIINELKERKLISDIPEGNVVRRREKEYREVVERCEPIHVPTHIREDGEIRRERRNIWDILYDTSFGKKELPHIDKEKTEGKIREEGIETLAWYRSYHWSPPERWGIYITDWGIYYIANVFSELEKIFYGYLNTSAFIRQSLNLLFLHEFFHYITDIAATTLEMSNSSQIPYYTNYHNNIYTKPRNEDEPLEEALANAFAYLGIQNQIFLYDSIRSLTNHLFRRRFMNKLGDRPLFFPFIFKNELPTVLYLWEEIYRLLVDMIEEDDSIFRYSSDMDLWRYPRRKKTPEKMYDKLQNDLVGSLLYEFMKNQPRGYSAFDKFLVKDNFFGGLRELASCISLGSFTKGIMPLEVLFDIYRQYVSFSDVPIYIVKTKVLPHEYEIKVRS